jgi:hypothetical protein
MATEPLAASRKAASPRPEGRNSGGYYELRERVNTCTFVWQFCDIPIVLGATRHTPRSQASGRQQRCDALPPLRLHSGSFLPAPNPSVGMRLLLGRTPRLPVNLTDHGRQPPYHHCRWSPCDGMYPYG